MYDVNNDDEMSEEKRKRKWSSILKAIFKWNTDIKTYKIDNNIKIYNATIKTGYFVAKRILVDESEEAVEDVLQDSYVAIYSNINTFSTGNFQGWVDVIVANRAKNYLKKKKPMLFSQMESEDEDAPELQFEHENIEFRHH